MKVIISTKDQTHLQLDSKDALEEQRNKSSDSIVIEDEDE